MSKFNDWLAVHVTLGMSTMWCVYLFAVIALLPLLLAFTHDFVFYLSSAIIQLVALPLIMVGQNRLSAASEARAAEDHTHISGILNDLQEDVVEMRHVDGRLAAIEAALKIAPVADSSRR